ncbi:MAG: clcB [Verrucomicrobiales bacterium]|nr:clcB [Verrucomicrobiales bacterium]
MAWWSKIFQRFFPVAQDFLQRHWKRALSIREHLRFSEETFHLLMAGVVGVIGGFTNFIFYTCIDWVQKGVFRRQVTFGEQVDLVKIAELLTWWQRLLVPTIGGLTAGLILHWGLHLVKKKGSTNFLEVVIAGDGRLPFRSAIIRGLSSLITIGSGGSIGREGAITHLSATFASKWGPLAKWQPYRLRLLVACGAASGLASPYNAPIAGAVFAAQIVLGNFSMNLFAPVVFSSVIATIVSRSFLNIQPYVVPTFNFTRVTQLPWFLLLGIICGVLGAFFLKMLRRTEEGFEKLQLPIYARLALGGLIVGLLAALYPQVWGNGYSVINGILDNNFTLEFLFAVLLAKWIATLATVGSGAVGGVFTPTLFFGAAAGALFGMVLHNVPFAVDLPTGTFALVGMCGALAATTRSPLLAMIMIFEISLNYSMMPALMLASVVATLVSKRLYPESIYTEPLRKKGLTIPEEQTRTGIATEQTIGDIMRAPIPPLKETATLREVASRFLTNPNNFLPVTDSENRLTGVVALQDLKEHLHTGQELDIVIAFDVMRPPPPCLTPSQRLQDALPTLLASEQQNIPVVNAFTENKLVGAVTRAEALGLLSEAISASKSAP